MTRDGTKAAFGGLVVLTMGAYSCIIEDLTIVGEGPDGGVGSGGGTGTGSVSSASSMVTSTGAQGGGSSSATATATATGTTGTASSGTAASSVGSGGGGGGAPNPTGWTHDWSKIFSGNDDEKVAKIAIDGSNDIFLTGELRASLTIDACSLMSAGNSTRDGFAAKLGGADGTCKWAKGFGDTSFHQFGTSVAVSSSGLPFLAGHFSGAISFDGQGGLSTNGGFNGYIAYLAGANGGFGGGFSLSVGEDMTNQFIESIASPPGGSNYLIATGFYQSNIPSLSPCSALTGTANDDNLLLMKIASDGTCGWASGWGSPANSERGKAVAVDAADNIYVTGKYQGQPSFNCMVNGLADATTSFNIFVAKFNSAGNCLWSRGYGSAASDEEGTSIAVDDQENVYVGGFFKGMFMLGSSSLSAPGVTDNLFVAKLDPSGTPAWAISLGDNFLQKTQAVAVDPVSHHVIATGTFAGSISAANLSLTAPGGVFAAFLIELNEGTGAPEGGVSWGTTSVSEGVDIRFDSAGDLIWAGNTSGTIDLGGGPLTSANKLDLVVAKFKRGM